MVERRTSWLGRLRALPNESSLKAILVAAGVSLAGSVLVATAAVTLKPLQDANRARERQQYIVEMVESLPGPPGLAAAADGYEVEARVVDLATGGYAAGIDPATYDQRAAANDPSQSAEIPKERDIAGIKRRAKYATVHLVSRDGSPRLVILPVHGKGFASTLYGYLGLSGDTESVVGIVFFEHGETPGLGALVNSPGWRRKWEGKMVWDELGNPALAVVMGGTDPALPAARYQVDGITGATWTSRGVTNLIRFWLGDDGFGPYLRKLRRK